MAGEASEPLVPRAGYCSTVERSKLQILCRGAVCNYAPDLVGQIKKAR